MSVCSIGDAAGSDVDVTRSSCDLHSGVYGGAEYPPASGISITVQQSDEPTIASHEPQENLVCSYVCGIGDEVAENTVKYETQQAFHHRYAR